MIYLLGGSGYVGWAYQSLLQRKGLAFRNLRRSDFDYSDPVALADLLRREKPDFLINAGGIINCAWERKGYNRKAALNQTENIYNTAMAIFKRSQTEKIPTYLAANEAAEHRVRSMRQAGLRF